MITETVNERENEKEIMNKLADAINYLVPYFDIDIAEVAGFHHEQLDISETKYLNEKLDLIIGKRAAHYLDFSSSRDCYRDVLPESSGMFKFVKEVIGHYGGLVYVNRNNRSWQLIGLGAEVGGVVGEAYRSADKIFDSYKDFRLEEIVRIKNLNGRFNKIKELTGELR